MIGKMDMPVNFSYLDVFIKGKPRHEKYDVFDIRHPRMSTGKRAKIFSPFNALKGFNEAIIAKEKLYEPRRDLSDIEKYELNRKLKILKYLTRNRKAAKENCVKAAVTYFVPCKDVNNAAYRIKGNYRTTRGIVMGIDEKVGKHLYLNDKPIKLYDIIRIEADDIFETDYAAFPEFIV